MIIRTAPLLADYWHRGSGEAVRRGVPWFTDDGCFVPWRVARAILVSGNPWHEISHLPGRPLRNNHIVPPLPIERTRDNTVRRRTHFAGRGWGLVTDAAGRQFDFRSCRRRSTRSSIPRLLQTKFVFLH